MSCHFARHGRDRTLGGAHVSIPRPAAAAVPKPKAITWVTLAFMTTASVASLRSAPTMAVYGLACVFLYIVPAIVFLMPQALVAAELASGWSGGVFRWVSEGISPRWGLLAVWCQFAMTIFSYPTLLEIVRRAQQAGFEAVHPGVACQEIDRAARKVISDAGYGEYFIHRVGHGIGITTHEPPYMVEGETHPIKPGMCFSIEPGVYLPGRFRVRIEDIVVATEDGARRLNNTNHEMRVVS